MKTLQTLAIASTIAILAGTAARAEPLPAGLTATVTQVKPAGNDDYSILLVVENASNKNFVVTKWTCLFSSGKDIVGQADIWVDASEASKQAAKTYLIRTFKPFDKSECRLTGAHQ